MKTRIKICGITSLADAMMAVEAGADALGFMFYESSPRHIPDSLIAEITLQLPPFVSRVGVFVNASVSVILSAIANCGLDTVQLHGDEPPELCQKLGRTKCIKAFRIRDAASLSQLPVYVADAWLLDSHVRGHRGGSGETFNWDLAVEASRLGRPIILAGGLTPHNVAEAQRVVRPYGLDVSSGVESAPGKKDAKKVRAFIDHARSVEIA